MFEIEVGHRFSASHAVSIGGVMEEIHAHDWMVRVAIRADSLDSEDLLVDFHAVEASLRVSVEPFEGRTMNGIPPFDRAMPTAERLAELVGEAMTRTLDKGQSIGWVSVEEAPGCIARWYPMTHDTEKP
ncbi:MAG: 6-carboxytetrahydropterin synthase [Phycisphaerales bacterium]|nr:6-carboxytetrahydropterin synthase [Phycisphaerales bacterium]